MSRNCRFWQLPNEANTSLTVPVMLLLLNDKIWRLGKLLSPGDPVGRPPVRLLPPRSSLVKLLHDAQSSCGTSWPSWLFEILSEFRFPQLEKSSPGIAPPNEFQERSSSCNTHRTENQTRIRSLACVWTKLCHWRVKAQCYGVPKIVVKNTIFWNCVCFWTFTKPILKRFFKNS